MDELDILAESLRRERFLPLLRKIIAYKKKNFPDGCYTTALFGNADVTQIIRDAGWTEEEFKEYYWGYHHILRKELNEAIEKKKHDGKSN
jgi:hypothetical protein